jgi:hypothetical protein
VIFELVFAFAKKYKGDNILGDFSLEEIRVSVFEAIRDMLLDNLPKGMREKLLHTKAFRLRDVSKPGTRSTAVVRSRDETTGNEL